MEVKTGKCGWMLKGRKSTSSGATTVAYSYRTFID
jgi:hypothetical protein